MNATIYGRLGGNAVVTEAGGYPLAKFGVALNVYKKGEKGVQWVNVSFFGTRAEKIAPYLTKGTVVAVAGDIKNRQYTSNGEDKTSLDMNAESVALLGGGQAREEEQTAEETAEAAPAVSDEDIPF